jgi:nitrite reductase (NO-forming)
MIARRTLLRSAALAATVPSLIAKQAIAATKQIQTEPVDIKLLRRKKVELVAPPYVHEHTQVASDGPSVVQFTMTIEEKQLVVDNIGTTIHAMTFNGSVPGPLMVVHQDDYVELTLINPKSNMLPHNIDFHAATGAMGGGELTLINPGQQTTLRFRATRTGTFVYHCAPGGAMIPWHVVSGMSGAIMVLPREGLTVGQNESITYDKVFYIGENDFYVPKDENGKFKKYSNMMEGYGDTINVMNGLIPSHVVFNGKVGALTGENAMKASVGETVLIIHAQANRDTRPHLIGGHADYAWETGKFANPPEKNLETWFIRGGSAGAAVYTFLQPGLYAYVNHNLIEAINLGAAAHFEVEGEWNNDLMEQLLPPTAIA